MKKAFTMIELVFVLVVVGIITAMIAPNFSGNNLREAAKQVISHIRYTQHLAMMDEKFDSNNLKWYLGRWQIVFSGAHSTFSYYILSEKKSGYNGNPDANIDYTSVEVARNPNNKNRYLIGVKNSNFNNNDSSKISAKLNLGKSYGISDITVSGGSTGSSAKRVLFDYLGRPYRGSTNDTVSSVINSPINRLATSPIFIKLCTSNCVNPKTSANSINEIIIKIEPETGYAHII